MSERSHKNLQRQNNEKSENLGDDFILEKAELLCPNCLSPCEPLQYYCDKCDSSEVINPLAAYMPFVRIRLYCGFFGKLWRTIWYEQQASIIRRLFCLFLIVLFCPILLIFGLPFLLIERIPSRGLRKAATKVFWIITVFLLLTFICFVLWT